MDSVTRKAKNCCSAKHAKRRFPILDWGPKYSSDDLLGDVVAGLTVGLTVIPQGIAYALIAGVPPNYGLYSSFMGAIVYTFLGSCKDITIGPTAIMSILSNEYTMGSAEIATLLCFLSGIIILIFGFFNLGFLINFVSKPVIIGFTSAAAITIATSQIGPLLGIKIKGKAIVEAWPQIVQHITETHFPDFILGIVCIVVLLLMRKLKDIQRFKRSPDDFGTQKAIKMAVFLISVGRNAIVVIIATGISFGFKDNNPFNITGEIQSGLPNFTMPTFSNDNATFSEIMTTVGSGVIVLPLISILEAIAIGSAFSQGKTLDATQEMLALGFCNLFGSFFQSIPTTGSFSRTAVNASSGVRTPAGGLVTALLVILSLAFLMDTLQYIPKSALGAVIICAVIFMVEYEHILPIWKVRKSDQIVLWTTFLVCMFYKLEIGIVCGVAVNILLLLSGNSSPPVLVHSIGEESKTCPHIVIEPMVGMQYVNIELIRNTASKAGLKEGRGVQPVVIDCKHVTYVDYSAAKGVVAMYKDFEKRSQKIILMNLEKDFADRIKTLCSNVPIVDSESLHTELKETIEISEKSAPSPSPPINPKNVFRRLSGSSNHDAVNPLIV